MRLYGLDQPPKRPVKRVAANIKRPRRQKNGVSKIVIDLEQTFAIQVRAVRLPVPRREFKFDVERDWRIDFAWPAWKIAVEIEGGTYRHGRHVRPDGFRKDCIKYNRLALLGWTLFRGDCRMVKDGSLLATVEKAIKSSEVQ